MQKPGAVPARRVLITAEVGHFVGGKIAYSELNACIGVMPIRCSNSCPLLYLYNGTALGLVHVSKFINIRPTRSKLWASSDLQGWRRRRIGIACLGKSQLPSFCHHS